MTLGMNAVQSLPPTLKEVLGLEKALSVFLQTISKNEYEVNRMPKKKCTFFWA